jgi:mono/diheme cytochrome c family protein
VSTFLDDGKQYVLAFSAGNALIGSARGDSVWLFGLDGTLPPVEPGTPVSRLAPEIPTTTSAAPAGAANPTTAVDLTLAAADVPAGQRLFEQTCVLCHGEDGTGGPGGGAPLDRSNDFAAVAETIRWGRNNMPEFGTSLMPEQIRDLAAYVVARLARANEP